MGSQRVGHNWLTNTHMLEEEEEPASEFRLPDSRGYFLTATWPPATQVFITAPPPTITLSQGPLKLSSLSVKCSEPQALDQFTDSWEVSHSFPLGPCFWSYFNNLSFPAWKKLSLPTCPPSGKRIALLIPRKVSISLLLHPHLLLFHLSPSEIQMKSRPGSLNSESKQNAITIFLFSCSNHRRLFWET